jgi:hypothetical protein
MRRRRIGLLLAVLGVLTLAGGCSEFNAARQTQHALARAGYRGVGVNVNTEVAAGQGRQTIVAVTYASRAPDDAALEAEQDRAAQIVWRNAPIRLSAVSVSAVHRAGVPGVVSVQTGSGRTYEREELAGRFGPRPASLDSAPATSVPAFVGVLVAVVVAVGIVVGVVALVVLARRRRRPPPGGAWPAGPQQPWPPQPQAWPAPGWGQPGPAQWPPPQQQWPPPGQGPASGPGWPPP